MAANRPPASRRGRSWKEDQPPKPQRSGDNPEKPIRNPAVGHPEIDLNGEWAFNSPGQIPCRVNYGFVSPLKVKKIILLLTVWLTAMPAFAWTDGELLVWMDSDRTRTLEPIVKKFEEQYSIKVRLEAPQNITD